MGKCTVHSGALPPAFTEIRGWNLDIAGAVDFERLGWRENAFTQEE